MMNPLELALARSKAYALFEMLYLSGVNPKTKASIEQVPELAACVDFNRGFDEMAADHYALFGHNLPPYASIFLEDDALPGGAITEQAQQAFRECGYKPVGTSEGADHIGHMMGCLAFLCGAESDAWEDGQHHVAGQMRQIQIEILEGQVLPWLFPFWWGIRMFGNPFYAELANLTLNITTDHYGSMENLHSPQSTPLAKEEVLNLEKAKLNDITDFLLKPAVNGLWLSSKTISAISREFELPRGFGERKTILLNLLKAAGKYDQFGHLMKTLSNYYSEAHIGFEKIKADQPHLAPFLFAWSLKIGGTNSILRNLEIAWKENQAVAV